MQERIYFDNAATTPIDPAVVEAMMPYLTTHFGNPSSIYSYGREAKIAIELARKSVAKILHATPAEIFFTSGGTESINTALYCAINCLDCTHIISSPIEHHATLHTIENINLTKNIPVQYLQINEKGNINLDELENILQQNTGKSVICLMHANNEIGNLINIHKISNLKKKYNAIFICDTVQTVGHFPIDLQNIEIDFITAAAHKFHGPKGVGMLYINKKNAVKPFIHGGSQERNMRAGTENIYGIVGFAKALEIATEQMEKDMQYITELKNYAHQQLLKHIPIVQFNGNGLEKSLYTLLNFQIPKNDKTDMLLFNLDIQNICVSSGSACSSGASQLSHVIKCICKTANFIPIRISFSKYNTIAEIDTFVQTLKQLIINN